MKSRLWSGAELLVTYPVLLLARYLPERLALGLGAALGRAVYFLLPRRRRAGEQNLALAFPDLPPAERRRILVASFRNLGRTMVEIVRLAVSSEEDVRRRVKYAPGALERLPRDRGVIVFTGHIGNWELLAYAHALHGHPMRLVVRRLENTFFNAMVQAMRQRSGNAVVVRGSNGNSVHELIEHLGDGGTVGLLVDQYAGKGTGLAVSFFGKPAWTHRGPALVAIRAGVPMAPAFLRRDEDRPGHYTIHVGEPIEAGGEMSVSERIHVLTWRTQQAVEQEIRARPEDWLWMHRRWKRSGDGAEMYSLRHRRKRRSRAERLESPLGGWTTVTGQR